MLIAQTGKRGTASLIFLHAGEGALWSFASRVEEGREALPSACRREYPPVALTLHVEGKRFASANAANGVPGS